MQQPIRASYLETDVMTATPERLQTMLIDGAIKNLQRGILLWRDNRDEEACESLIRAQQIIAQILAGFRREVDAELARKVAAVYLFLFRTIGEGAKRPRRRQTPAVHPRPGRGAPNLAAGLREARKGTCRKPGPGGGSAIAGRFADAAAKGRGSAAARTALSLWAGDAGGGGVSTGFSIEA